MAEPGEVMPDVSIRWRDVDPNIRRPVMSSLGAHIEGAVCPHPDPSHVPTVVAGVRKRFACKPPTAQRKMLRRLRAFTRRWVRRNLTPLAPDTDVSLDGWLSQTNYTERRKASLRETHAELHRYRTTDIWKLVKSFIKDEVYPEYKHARPINSRHDAFKVMTGPIFKAIEKKVFDLPYFIKKVPVRDRPQYIIDKLYSEGSLYYVSDYTAFEANFTPELMEACEFELYEYMTEHLAEGSEFMSLMREVIAGVNTCKFSNVTVKIKGKRMSGEMNTSLGNGFSNLMFMLFMCDEVGSKDVDGVVEGDDGLFRLTGHPPTADDFAKLGLMIKPEVHTSLNEASFCGMIFDLEDRIVVTDPREVLATTGWGPGHMTSVRRATRVSLLRCKALSIAHQYPGCPILQEFAHYLLRVTRGYDLRPVLNSRLLDGWSRDQLFDALRDERGIARQPVGSNSRDLVARRYGISIDDQIAIEEYFAQCNVLGPIKLEAVCKHMPDVWKHYYETYVQIPIDKEFPVGPWLDRADVHWDTKLYGRRR